MASSKFKNLNGFSRIDWNLEIDFENSEYHFFKAKNVVGEVFTLGALLYTNKGVYGDSIILVNKDDKGVVSCVWCPPSNVGTIKTILDDPDMIKEIIEESVQYTIESYINKKGQTGYKVVFI